MSQPHPAHGSFVCLNSSLNNPVPGVVGAALEAPCKSPVAVVDFGSDSETPDEEFEDEQSNGQHHQSEQPARNKTLSKIPDRNMCFIRLSYKFFGPLD